MTMSYEAYLAEYEDKENKWEYVAKEKGFRCKRCGETPMFSEREVYFDTGFCGYCAHMAEKLEEE